MTTRKVPSKSETPEAPRQELAYSGFHQRKVPSEDAEITHTGPETPLGEYMRRFWQPVCFSDQLRDVPHKIKIMGEKLVAFRDRRGRVAVMQRHCCHRGASLEYGIIQECGIRCCYHGIQYDIDGTVIDIPGEPNADRIKTKMAQGAYPAFERDGLVFAYMGPPGHKPPFPEYDAFEKTGDTRLLPFSNVFPCNWLQVMDNIADQMHTYQLHNPSALYGSHLPEDLNMSSFTLSAAFVKLPVMDYLPVRDGTGMVFIAGRRVSEDLVWVRMNDLIVPNIGQHAYLFEDGSERRLWHRVHMSRWYVPVDDENSIIFGWRMFGEAIDPLRKGNEKKVGWDDMDFLDGQVGNRTYEEGQRLPGDWEAVMSQRKIAVHALENPLGSDRGVYLLRRLIRDAVRQKNPQADPARMHRRAQEGRQYPTYTNNTILRIPRKGDRIEDERMILNLGRTIVSILAEADQMEGRKRDEFIRARLEGLEKEKVMA
ncbi:MAG: Rieske 2Fe-2S domain-containing protein [Hyphomicrobiales bacterium]